jgi:hypothetical protein
MLAGFGHGFNFFFRLKFVALPSRVIKESWKGGEERSLRCFDPNLRLPIVNNAQIHKRGFYMHATLIVIKLSDSSKTNRTLFG